jgi:branched-chain amino acid transport system substrate-binding protein
MRLTRILATAAALAAFGIGPGVAFAQNEQFIPRLVYRTGPYAPNGIPFADGYADYLDMVNARDGGVGGVKITYEECETAYNNDKGVECYERLKGKGPTGASLVDPLSTGITYALIERATADKIPVVSMGYGRADASDGAVFPYVFTLPTTYWSQADDFIKYVGQKEGGIDKLKGKKIGLVYIDIAYGKEPIATLEKLSQKYGYTFLKYPVSAPGIEQSATWLQIRQQKPDWLFLWGWGVMNSTAIKGAASVGFPSPMSCRPARRRTAMNREPSTAPARISARSRTSSNTSMTSRVAIPPATRSARCSTTAASSTRFTTSMRSAPRRANSARSR